MNNQDRFADRQETMLFVGGHADYVAALASSDPIRVHPREGTQVKVQIKLREGFKGAVTVQLIGLPSGWVTNPMTAPANKDEVTLLVRPDGNNTAPFLNRDPTLPPIRAILDAASDEFHFAFGTVEIRRPE